MSPIITPFAVATHALITVSQAQPLITALIMALVVLVPACASYLKTVIEQRIADLSRQHTLEHQETIAAIEGNADLSRQHTLEHGETMRVLKGKRP